jgi:hypothetical protein
VFIKYSPEKHEQIFTQIEDFGAFNLYEGDYVAIEVECSDPAKTGISNIEKNIEAGIHVTILAVFQNQLRRVRDSIKDYLPKEMQASFTIVDCLNLLNNLREKKSENVN